MRCDDPACNGNHHQGYPNICPAATERHRRKRRERYWADIDASRAYQRIAYEQMGGVNYSRTLLRHRRTKALQRKQRRTAEEV